MLWMTARTNAAQPREYAGKPRCGRFELDLPTGA
jgi:hypothetical protein